MKKAILFTFGLLFVSFLAFAQATITAPNGGESWVERTSHNITWTHSGANFTVKLQLFQGETRIGVIRFGLDLTADSYTWAEVGLLEDGTRAPAGVGYTVRILRQSDNTLLDQSNAGFSITSATPAASLTLIAPNGGESWAIGGPSQNIRWSSTGLTGTVRLILFQGGTAESNRLGEIEDGLAVGTGSYSWTVGSYQGGTATAGSGYYIRVRAESSETADVSERPFSLTGAAPAASITATSPNGGESWEFGSSHPITWRASNVSGTVNILLLNGGVVGTIATGQAATTGSYPWTVGDYQGGRATARGGYRIRVQHSSGSPVDDSNADFAITPEGGGSTTGHDLTISNPILQSYGSGHGFRVTVTSLNSDINEWVDISTYCLGMGLGNAKHDRRRVELSRGASAHFNLQNMDPHLWGNKCGVDFTFRINGGPDGPHDVIETNYENNFVVKQIYWVHDNHDGRVFQEQRLGKNYTHACEACQVTIRPEDCTSHEGNRVTIFLEITIQNCGALPTPEGTIRVTNNWRYLSEEGRLQDDGREVDNFTVPVMEAGHFNILRRSITLERSPSYNELIIEYNCGEDGSLNNNNKFHCHPNFIGF